MAEITFEGVSKVYDDGTEAVLDFDLQIPHGTFMVLVGPSGCGKTTALRMVAGLEEITAGTIRLGDRVINDVQPKNRDLAMVFQNYALYPHMSVYDNIAFGLRLRKIPGREVRTQVEKAAATLGLSDLLKKKPRHLSGGQRQRVAMGRAIVRDPKAFLMDEPLSNLDAKLRVQMRAEIARIQRDLGVTTIYVTHDQTEAMTMGDQVAVMRDGLLQQVGTPQDVYAHPRNLFSAGFIGSPAMNLIEARLVQRAGELTVEFADTRLRLDDRPGNHSQLASFVGRSIVLGIRPEDMEDAALIGEAPADRRIGARVDLCEVVGPEVYLHFTVDAPPALTDDTRALAAETGDEAVEALEHQAGGKHSAFVARVNRRTAAREGANVELLIDTAALHFFDPQTGNALS